MATFLVTTANWNSPAFWSAINESAGGHVLDFSGLPGSYSVAYNYRTGEITISDGTTSFAIGDTTALGGPYDATLSGSSVLNFFDFVGSEGDDTVTADGNANAIDGGGGIDEVDYSNSASEVSVSLSSGTGSGGDAAGDTYTNIENITGSAFDDQITGDGSANVLDGGDGADVIAGAGGTDSILGGIGNDVIYGDTADGSTYGTLNLTNTDNVQDGSSATGAKAIRAVELVELADGTVIMITSERTGLEDGIATFQIDNDPTSATYGEVLGGPIDDLREDATPSSGAGYDAIEDIAALTLSNGQSFVYTADYDQGTIGVAEISLDGSLTLVTQVSGFDQPQELEAVEIGGNAFLLVMEGGSANSLSTYQIQGDGTLSLVETQTDGSGTTENFLNNGAATDASLLESFTNSAGETFVIAGGVDDGISLWTMNDSGNLAFQGARGDNEAGGLETDPQGNDLGRDLVSPLTTGLADVDAAVLAEIDGQTYVFTGGFEDEVNIFRIDVDTVNNDGTFDLTLVGAFSGIATDISALEILQTDDGHVLVIGGEQQGLEFHSVIVNADGTVDLTLADTVADGGEGSAELLDSEDIDVLGGLLVSASDNDSGVAIIDTGLNAEPQFADNDTIDGGTGDDIIFGQGGDDSIVGDSGNDTIYGDGVRTNSSQLLTNGSFDNDIGGWTIINPTGGQVPVYTSQYDGVRLNSSDEAAGGDGISQQFGTVAGETYYTSVDLEQNGVVGGNHNVLVQILDENGTEIDSFLTTIGLGGSDTVEIDFVATTATSEIRITNPSSDQTTGTDVLITGASVIGPDPDAASDDGADIIDGGSGDDLIVGGTGADSIDGGADNDTIYGDGNAVRESLNYENLTTQQLQDGVTVNTGNVDVTFSSPTETGITLQSPTTSGSISPFTGGVIDDGSGVDPDSVMQATAVDSNSLGVYQWGFSEPVTNVSFNITDLDEYENIQILAFDENGNPVEVILTPGSNVSVSDSNGDGIDDLAEGSDSLDPIDASQAVTVNIPGPVSSIRAIHTLDVSGGNLGIQFTETFFDVLAPGTSGDDDTIDGGSGNDVLYGEGGDDVVEGGAGADEIYGGDGADTIYTGVSGSFTQDLSVSTSTTVDAGDGDDHVYVTDIGDASTDDQLDGGAGIDTIYFEFNPADYGGSAGHTIAMAETGQTRPLDGLPGDQYFENFENVVTGAGDDVLTGNSSDNMLDGGAGNDSIDGGDGDDTLFGGTGDDTLVAGNSGASGDSLFGGDGNDELVSSFGVSTLSGGDGSDRFEVGFGDTSVVGGEDVGDFDTLSAALSDDAISVSFDGTGSGTFDDLTDSDSGSFSEIEAVEGSSGADTIDAALDGGGVGLSGNAGDDSIIGGSGDDTIDGGAGSDSMTGGGGDDTFTYTPGDGLDTITDFNAGNTGGLLDGDANNNDFIDLSSYYDHINELYADQADDGILNQSNSLDSYGKAVDYLDNTQFDTDGTPDNEGISFTGATGNDTFFTVENTGVVCLAAGTLIRTPNGEVAIEELRCGDEVLTVDHGAQPLLWVGSRCIGADELRATPSLRPIHIPTGLFGNHSPLLVSPQHGMMLDQAHGLADQRLARAVHLAEAKGPVRVAHGKKHVQYHHLMFARHQLIWANGAPTESLYPGPNAMKMFGDRERQEIQRIVTGLEHRPVSEVYGPTAREFLKRREVEALFDLGTSAKAEPMESPPAPVFAFPEPGETDSQTETGTGFRPTYAA